MSALDAAWVLQSIAGLRSLDATQRRACDVTGNGTLSTLDATDILQRAVGTIAHLPVADLCGSDFTFEPVAAPPIAGRMVSPVVAAGVCQPGAIELEPLSGAVGGLDFRAAAFGDCTGNWSAAPALRRHGALPRVRVGRIRRAGGRWRLALAVFAAEPLSAVELALALAPGAQLRGVRPLGAGRDAMVRIGAGGVRVALASRRPLAGLRLVLSGDGAAAGAPVRITAARVDEAVAAVR